MAILKGNHSLTVVSVMLMTGDALVVYAFLSSLWGFCQVSKILHPRPALYLPFSCSLFTLWLLSLSFVPPYPPLSLPSPGLSAMA